MFRRTSLAARAAFAAFSLVLTLSDGFSKDAPPQVLVWPQTGEAVIRFTFGKFKSIGGLGTQRNYVLDTSAQNLTDKSIPSGRFNLYVFDKSKVRIGEAPVAFENLAAGGTIKFQTTISAAGQPVSLSIAAFSDTPKSVYLTVNSVPQGATLSVDGKVAGVTPKLVTLGLGKHLLDFSKEGFHTGSFPLEIGADDASGGSISYELGAAAMDTVELRDGTVVTGDVISVTASEVVIRAGGNGQHIERNKVKRILLTERTPTAQP